MKLKSKDEDTKYEKASDKLNEIIEETGKIIVGQEDILEKTLIAIICDGNVLLESNPGLGKTKMISTLSQVIGLDFSRIQSTPDLMPSDITGTHIINEEDDGSKEFVFQKGPIFANMILADEINRATPKTQSALLEAMQEKQVTAGNQTYELEKPFFLMATQNPIDQEGTYPLPEAQQDRFMMKLKLDYPEEKEEHEIVDRFTDEMNYEPGLEQVISQPSLLKLQEFTHKVPIADDIREKAVKTVSKTREHQDLEFGASPRASIHLVLAAKGKALIERRNYVSEQDIKDMAIPVLRHRIGLNFKAEKQGKTPEEVIQQIKEGV
ncbi:MAG: AAA family ATPase [Candidatus Nanohaloarchaea archaeon]